MYFTKWQNVGQRGLLRGVINIYYKKLNFREEYTPLRRRKPNKTGGRDALGVARVSN